MRGGTYNEHVTINVSGTSGSPITFQSYPGEQAVIDGTGIALSGDKNPLVDLNGRSYIVFKGFELRNNKTSAAGIVPIGIYVSGGSVGVESAPGSGSTFWARLPLRVREAAAELAATTEVVHPGRLAELLVTIREWDGRPLLLDDR